MPVPAGSQTNNLDVRDECTVRGRVVTDNLDEFTAGSGVTFTDNLAFADTTNSTSTATGSIQTAGGLGVVQDAFVGGSVDVGGNIVGATDDTTEIRGMEPSSVDSRTVQGMLRLTYDFAVDGGAVGTISLGNSDDFIPSNALVTRSYYEVTTTLSSNGGNDAASIQLGADDGFDIVADVAISVGTPWDAGAREGIQTGAASAILSKSAGSRRVEMVITVEAIDVGAFVLVLEYVVSD